MYGHPHHIPQPPHSAGHPFSGLRARIHPEQIPSPIDAAVADQDQWRARFFMTLPGSHVPLSGTDYVAVDQGNSNPRFVRMTTWHLPATADLADACQIPLAAILQPFAEPAPGEEPVPIVQCDPAGPPRCARCRAYVNPWCTWAGGGTRWTCNLCGTDTEVVPEYFCSTDANGMRLDHQQRPELTKGTVDFEVSEAYWAPHPPPRLAPSFYTPEPPPPPASPGRAPCALHVIVVLDVTRDAVHTGFTQAACAALRDALFGSTTEDGVILEPCFPPGGKLAIMTFDDTLHFYDLSPDRPQASMLVVPDLDYVYTPLRDELFVDPQSSRPQLEALLDALPRRFEHTAVHASALGAALYGSLAALARRGGHVLAFAGTLPTRGPGALPPRVDEAALYDSDRERALFAPRNATWRDLAEECADAGIGVSLFVGAGSNAFLDVGSIGAVATMTGGDIFFHPRFDAASDTACLAEQVRRTLVRTAAYDCTVRVRCSNGLRVAGYLGALHARAGADAAIGVLSADSAFSAALSHTRSIDADAHAHAHVQCAVLHTTPAGRRHVRVLNVAVPAAALAGNVFRFADVDAVVCHMAKEAMVAMSARKLADIREGLTEKCSSILLAYRRNCAAATAPSQLILPEAFKLLPLYTLGLQKSKPIKGFNVTADTRNALAHRILAMPVRTTLRHLYPRLLSLHDLPLEVDPDPDAPPRLPPCIRATHMCMEAHGVYLIDNEELAVLWVGGSATPQLLLDLFGVDSVHHIDARMTHLPLLQTQISAKVRGILSERRAARGGFAPKLLVARQNLDGAEIEFSDMLVEDRNNGAMSYIDYLCFVHKQINVALTNGTSISGGNGFGLRGAPW